VIIHAQGEGTRKNCKSVNNVIKIVVKNKKNSLTRNIDYVIFDKRHKFYVFFLCKKIISIALKKIARR